jgi:hypothetical protein
MLDSILKAIQQTPLPTILVLAGLIFILLGFVTKIGGIIDVSPEQKRWTIPIGLFVLFIGLALNFATPISIPSGSYLKTCQNMYVRGDVLYASCKRIDQQYNPTSLEKFNDCKSISNINGSLQCDN